MQHYHQQSGRGMPPPPPPPQQPQQSQTPMGMQLPPPPPRQAYVQQSHGMMPRHAQPGTIPPNPMSYWARQQSGVPQQYNPNSYLNYGSRTQMNLQPQQQQQQYHQQHNQDADPIVSATFIPAPGSFGPGVGIPPLWPQSGPYSDGTSYFHETRTYHGANDSSRDARDGNGNENGDENGNGHENGNENGHGNEMAIPDENLYSDHRTYTRDVTIQPRGNPGYSPPGPPTATRVNQKAVDLEGQSGRTPVSPPLDPALQWPLDRVLLWLAGQGYSREWQETFNSLGIFGVQFLDLGKSQARGSVAFMHQVIIPQLARECTANGTVWDQAKEREQGRNLRRMIRRIVENGGNATAIMSALGHHRATSLPSSGPDGEIDTSPQLGRDTTPTTAGTDNSPGAWMPQVSSNTPAPTLLQRRRSAQRIGDYLTENGRSGYAEAMLRGIGDNGGKRHSPSPSRDLHISSSRQYASPQNSPGLPSASGVEFSWRQYHPAGGHQRLGSNEHFRPRNATESSRPTTLESRSQSSETPASARDHKHSIFSRFKSKKKDEQPEESSTSVDSPTSPECSRTISGFSKKSQSIAQTYMPGASLSSSGHVPRASSTNPPSGEGARFAFVTPDGYNYRLVDISHTDSGLSLRHCLCENLGIQFSPDVSFHHTSPGQTEHDEDLSDDMLIAARRNMGDSDNTLKLFVHHVPASLPDSQTLGPIGNAPVIGLTSPYKMTFTGKASRLRGDSGASGATAESPSVGSGEETLVPVESHQKQIAAAAEQYRQEVERKRKAYTDERRRAAAQGKVTNFDDRPPGIRRESEIDFDKRRKSPYEQRELVPLREPPPVPPGDTSTLIKANSLTKKGGQKPRQSWEEDGGKSDEHDDLRGRAGPTSSGTAVLQPSPLSQEQSHRQRSLALALSGQASRNAISPAGSPRSPSFTMSKGNVNFKIPEYAEDPLALEQDTGSQESTLTEHTMIAMQAAAINRTGSGNKPSLTLQTGSVANPTISKLKIDEPPRGRQSPAISPSSHKPTPPATLTRVASKRGPTHDFEEAHVDFSSRTPALIADDSDDDSDDGLFAVQIRKADQSPISRSSPSNATATAGLSHGASTHEMQESRRPSITVRTNNMDYDPSPPSGIDHSASTESPHIDYKEFESGLRSGGVNIPQSAASTWSPDEPSGFNRRESFASDIWANRPPTQQLVEHLDEFFPNVNLDQPVLEEDLGTTTVEGVAQSANYMPSRQVTPMSSLDEDSEGFGSLARNQTITTIAQRNMHKSGRLGRTKSIREVVKDAYQQRETGRFNVPGPARVTTLRPDAAGGIVRRKSTKMFGAKIEQVKLQRSSKLIQLETIPQDTLPVMQRQVTFKWMKGNMIGTGTFGRVYLGMNMTTGELIAVKQVEVSSKAAGHDKEKMKEMVKSLDMEIDTMKDLDHPNIVSYLGCEKGETSISIFLEYIPGGSVATCLRIHGKFEEPVVSSLTRQTLSALAYLHREGILHRDLKADNILLDLDGTCKISDFGISKKSDDIYGNDVTNSMQGSVFWMAPEVIQSQGLGYSAKIDIWSLGCVVLEMFAGRRPWSKEEAIGAIYKLGSLNQAPPIPDDVSETISPAAISFMYDCFTIDPQDRPTAETLLRAPFCFADPRYNFLDSVLYSKIRGAFGSAVAS